MTGALRLQDRVLTDVVAAVRPSGGDERPHEVFAAAAWTALVEPGDSAAGWLVSTLGAAGALEAVLLDAPPSRNPRLREAFDRWRSRADPVALLRAVEQAARIGARLLVPGDPDWPAGLTDLDLHAPLALWALAPTGPLPSLTRSVALVGTRAPTPYGVHVTSDLGCGLADLGFAIVSGAAAGIDRVAHHAALGSGGVTAAVLAGGVDRFYPSGNVDLLQRIAAEGVVLAEMACGSRPMKQRFLSRNRLIAAITRATVVVEAGIPSGAINTAGHAAELGRPVAAVPGSVHSAASAGCHKLLREYAAVLVRDTADVVELVRDPGTAVTLDGLDGPLDPDEQAVLGALGRSPRPAADIARRTGLGEDAVATSLALLALTGAVVESARGWVRG